MKLFSTFIIATMVATLILLVCPIQAESGNGPTSLYVTAFSTNPQWTTNNPSSDYWDPGKGMYHFRIEPSTQNYAYTPPIEYVGGSFTLEYDVTLEQVDEGTSFRLGFSGTEMDRSKGPNVLTEFTNDPKYGNILWLRLVTMSAKLMEVNSHTSFDTASYRGPTFNFEMNKTYHVVVNYDDSQKTLTERVTEKTTGKQVWSYYLNTWEPLHGMNRIYIGSGGDYGVMNRYAIGYIDNVRLYAPAQVTVAPTDIITQQTTVTPRPTTRKPTTVPTTPTPAPTSPPSIVAACAALGIVGAVAGMQKMRKNR